MTVSPSIFAAAVLAAAAAATLFSTTATAAECGKRYHDQRFDKLQHWIVGGVEALKGAYPYQVSVELYNWIYGSEHLCGGTLVASKWIVTAAHCIIEGPDPRNYRVVVGRHDFDAVERSMKRFSVKRVFLHPDYYDEEGDMSNDIALLELKLPVSFGEFVQPACLPEKTLAPRIYAPGAKAVISGWGEMDPRGVDQEETGRRSRKMRAAQVPIIDLDRCRKANEDYRVMITDAMVCAGYMEGGIDGCQGDSGGPLVADVDGKATLIGVVSWGLGCAQKNHPGLYTNVVYELDWIKKYVK